MAETGSWATDQTKIERLSRRLSSPWILRGFMLTKLPLGLFAGIRVVDLDTEICRTTVPYGWRTTNPFRSTYFAALSMAAELSTGALAMLAVELAPASMAMLITDLDAKFVKKATGKTTFTCDGGGAIFGAVHETLDSDQPTVARVETVGRSTDGVEVCRFHFDWSFKRRGRNP